MLIKRTIMVTILLGPEKHRINNISRGMSTLYFLIEFPESSQENERNCKIRVLE